MNVTLFIPCYVDLFYPHVGIDMVHILERLGHTVICPDSPACCGQPAFNTGYWDEAAKLAIQMIDTLRDAEVVVIASGSCGAMIKVFYSELLAGTEHEAAAVELGSRCYEFSQFLVDRLGVTDVGAKFEGRVTFHDGCHGLRELGGKDPARELMAHVEGLELVETFKAETCCGFGGTFAAKFPDISSAMGDSKCESALETKADYLVSNDCSCLMHLQGLIDKKRPKPAIRTIHLAEILART